MAKLKPLPKPEPDEKGYVDYTHVLHPIEGFEPHVTAEERDNTLALLHEYGYNIGPSDHLHDILIENHKQKSGFRNVFAHDPGYIGDGRIVWDYIQHRPRNEAGVARFQDRISDMCKEYLRDHQTTYQGLKYNMWVARQRSIEQVRDALREDKDTATYISEKLNLKIPLLNSIRELVGETQSVLDTSQTHFGINLFVGPLFQDTVDLLELLHKTVALESLTQEQADNLNVAFFKATNKKLNAQTNSQVHRVVRKICEEFGFQNQIFFDETFDQAFTKYADAAYPKDTKMKCILTVNMYDFYTMSFGANWTSCQTIDKTNIRHVDSRNQFQGCHSSGTESYGLDSTTFLFFMLKEKDYQKFLDGNPKWIYRTIFNVDHNKMIQGRVYPQSKDGDKEFAKTVRDLVVKRLEPLLQFDFENSISVFGTRYCNENSSSHGTHYADYSNFDTCMFICFDKMSVDLTDKIQIGAEPICPVCGRRHYHEENIICDDCLEEYGNEVYEYYGGNYDD